MTTGRKIREIMTTELVTIDISETIHELLDRMNENDVSTLPVMRSDICVGMVTARDLLETTSESEHLLNDAAEDIFDRLWIFDNVRERLGNERVEAVMSHATIRISADATVEQAAELMLQHEIHHLPVIESDETLVGLVSSWDLLNILAPRFDRRNKQEVRHRDTASAEAYERLRS